MGWVEERIAALLEHLPAFRQAIARWSTIPGVKEQTALLMVSEVGVDLSRFPSDRQLTSWAGLVPGQNESGGKRRPARARKGHRAPPTRLGPGCSRCRTNQGHLSARALSALGSTRWSESGGRCGRSYDFTDCLLPPAAR